MKIHKPKSSDINYGWAGAIMVTLVCVGLMALGILFFMGIVEDWATDSVLIKTSLNVFFGLVFCAIPTSVFYALCISTNNK